MIEEVLPNPFKIITHVKAQRAEVGATAVRFEGTLANERLLNSISKRYNVISENGNGFFEILVKQEK